MLGATKIADILRAFHQNTTAAIKSGTISFKLGSGVRQGSDQGPTAVLFVFAICTFGG